MNGFELVFNGVLHQYTRHKPINSLSIMSNHDIGEDAYISIINGHSGCKESFLNESSPRVQRGPFVAALDVSKPTYLRLDFQQDRFESRLRVSDSNEVKDLFVMTRKEESAIMRKLLRNMMILLFISAILVTIMIFYVKLKNKTQPNHNQSAAEDSAYQSIKA